MVDIDNKWYVREEYNDLEMRYKELYNFIYVSLIFDNLDEYNQWLLKCQLSVMDMYIKLLKKRMNYNGKLKKEINNE